MDPLDMDSIYRDTPLDQIPWNIESPPRALVDLVEGGGVQPCRAVDFGCGAGNYAVYLAGKGFDVTGIDLSPTAIDIARQHANEKGVTCTFVAADVLGDLDEVRGPFGLAYDWELLHHLFPNQRETYVQNVAGKVSSGGHYLSVCFSERDPQFGGSGKYRETPVGTTLYFSSEDELSALFGQHFRIVDLRTLEIEGKWAPHLAVYALMEKP